MIRLRMRLVLLLLICGQQPLRAQSFNSWQTDLTRQQSYTLKRASSADTTGGNADFRPIEPGKTLTLLDADGPGVLTHIWIDRKSTRLNSSHLVISYAVFCLKKKKRHTT